MSLSLGSEIAAGSSGDNSPSLRRLLQEREQRGMKGPGRHFVLQLLVLCPHGKAGSKDHRWKNISYREREREFGSRHPSGLSKSCASAVSSSLFMCSLKECSCWFSRKAVLVMLRDYKFGYLENLKFKLGVDSFQCYSKADGFFWDLHLPT